MSARPSGDWTPGDGPALPLALLVDGAELMEFAPSPDGLRLAAVVADPDGMRVRILGPGISDIIEWPGSWERARQLRWSADGRLAAITAQDDEWTVVEDGQPWPDTHEFLWDLRHTADGHAVAAIKTGDGYGLSRAGVAWPTAFPMVRDFCVSPQGGRMACTVQVEPKQEADIEAFAAGLWSLAVDGEVWSRRFVNVWEPVLSADGQRAAALVRVSRTEHTVAVDGEPWDQAFGCAWGPSFTPDGAVLAPVKIAAGWTLARDGQLFWDGGFAQLWRQKAAGDGRVAAVVAPEFGRWTVAVDGKPWSTTWDEWAGDPVFGTGGDERVAAAVKDHGCWTVAVDGRPWDLSGERLHDPVILPAGGPVLAVIEREGHWQLVADGHPVGGVWHKLWPLIVGPDGATVLMRGLGAEGNYVRRVVNLTGERSRP